ncbi:hypothetical protein OBBRIDRAFT_796257 [Obba rivulosa]|uniref:Uncharacterized protein n=1 Tax=Obba rivulosa TaxID=1052685 RepID=A0A8E2DLY9_9APHY|nr:hypothetical protein OBBRIDRAFT_796257 [Obba rivulosa]
MQSDRRRYVDEVQLEEPIMFYMLQQSNVGTSLHNAGQANSGTQQSTTCGIPLRDCLANKFDLLIGREDLMFENRGPSVSIRLMWPGYPPWSRQIPTRDFRSPPGPITRAKLAKNVAKTIHRFIEETQGRRMEDDGEARWRVGPNYIDIDDLILVGLQHVSMGSWQAHLRVLPRS